MALTEINALSIILLIVTPFLAILLEGFRRKFIARMQNRVGPPLIQPFYDIIKLFQKEKIKGRNAVFRAMPYFAVINALALLLFVPFSVVSFELDFIVFGYLFILLDTFFLLGALASGSPFGFHATVRELILMIGYEIAFLIVLSIFMLKAGVTSLAAFDLSFAFLQVPVASLGLLATGLVILKVTPFDVVIAEPEISAGLFTEYAGRRLALLEIAEFIKNGVFYFTLGLLLFGRIYAIPLAFFFVFLYALSQVTSPRYSIFKSGKIFLLAAFILFLDLMFLV